MNFMSSMFQPPKGMRDLSPAEASKFQRIVGIVRSVFEQYGFVPLETPAVEGFELLGAKGGLGEAVKNEIYYFKDKSDRELGLRFDLTMPLVRYVISNPNISKPFRRYAIGKVWRYDNPQSMRWREFWQADIDIVGSSNTAADIECVSCAADALLALGFEDFEIRFNDRKMIESLLLKAGVQKDKIVDAFRSIDKLDKIGFEGVVAELKQSGIKSEGVFDLLKISGRSDIILKKLESSNSDGTKEVVEFVSMADAIGLGNKLRLDLSLVRGLEYYTGLVFEVNLGGKASCGGGGRYDNLIGQLSGQQMSATGISLGLDRIFAIMEEQKMSFSEPRTKVFIAATNEEMRLKAFQVARELRTAGAVCELDIMGKSFSKQLEYAGSRNFPFCVIIGPREISQGKVKIRDMINGNEAEMPMEKLAEWAKAL